MTGKPINGTCGYCYGLKPTSQDIHFSFQKAISPVNRVLCNKIKQGKKGITILMFIIYK